MPYGRHRIPGTISKKVARGKATRYAYRPGTVMHRGRKYRQRLGFRGKARVVELSLVPLRKRR